MNEKTDLTRECSDLELIINNLATGNETCDIRDDHHSLDAAIGYLRDFLQELKELNDQIIGQGNTPALLKTVHDKYTELWLFQLSFYVSSLSRVIGALWQYPNSYGGDDADDMTDGVKSNGS